MCGSRDGFKLFSRALPPHSCVVRRYVGLTLEGKAFLFSVGVPGRGLGIPRSILGCQGRRLRVLLHERVRVATHIGLRADRPGVARGDTIIDAFRPRRAQGVAGAADHVGNRGGDSA